MGADILLYALPHCELTEERKDKITETVEAVSDKDILSYNDNFLCIDLAISSSGEIITSIGKFSLL